MNSNYNVWTFADELERNMEVLGEYQKNTATIFFTGALGMKVMVMRLVMTIYCHPKAFMH